LVRRAEDVDGVVWRVVAIADRAVRAPYDEVSNG
jgi:hypothetical protein